MLFHSSCFAFHQPEVSNADPSGSLSLCPTGGLLDLVRFRFWYLCGVGHFNSSHAVLQIIHSQEALSHGFPLTSACSAVLKDWLRAGTSAGWCQGGGSSPCFLLASMFGTGLLFIRNFKGPVFLVRGAEINCGRIAAEDSQARRLPPRPQKA